MTYDFSKISEVRLEPGQHATPKEGLCFMEMVAWFAGEDHSDQPACACPVLTAYGIGLNDEMYDGARDALLKPLIPLIAGTRDRDSERSRERFLAMWTVNRILPLGLRAGGYVALAERAEAASCLCGAISVIGDALKEVEIIPDVPMSEVSGAFTASLFPSYIDSIELEEALQEAEACLIKAAPSAAPDYEDDDEGLPLGASCVAEHVARALGDREDEVWELAVEGLRQAILLGRHEGFGEIDLGARHLELVEAVA